MPRIAMETGGDVLSFRPNNMDDLKTAFDQIEQQLRMTYCISYVSTNSRYNGKFRRIEIKTKRKMHIRARRGYRVLSSVAS